MRRTLIIMVKAPRPGRVKTRLARDIGQIPAVWWFRHQVARLLRRIEDPRWDVVLAVAPDSAVFRSGIWPDRFARWPQGQGDLGQRMARMMRSASPGQVCVIGADIPGVTRDTVWRAFEQLGTHEAVFGPAEDGGYWLVGLRHAGRVPAGFLDTVRWSSIHALDDSVASLPGRSIGYADTLADVDTGADLARLS